MASPEQLKHLATHPAEYMKYVTTGTLPQGVKPTGALVVLLNAIGGRDRVHIHGVTVDARLGYAGSRRFATAEQAYQWVKPAEEVFGSFPAESWRLKGFQERLWLEDLMACSSSFPDQILSAYRQLRRPTPRRPMP